ncbi:MAG: choice-of-anchor V domain-containing protein [Bacteroidota bacterium]|nr:choice-of-anchor V domain-containing protein [Bacteroidota bacterium]
MKKNIITASFTIILFLFYSLIAKNDGGPPYNTKAPGEKSCSGTEGANSCHSGGIADNAGPGTASIIFDNGNTTYIPGQTYIIKPRITHYTLNKFGFQIVSLRNSDNKFTGTITLIDTNKTRMQSPTWGSYQDRNFVMHRIAGTAPVSANTGEWTYQWKAPSTNQGAITFYASMLAANGDNASDKNDQTYNTKLIITPFNTIENVSTEPVVSVYPNPINDNPNITLHLANAQALHFEIIDLNGKNVYNTTEQKPNTGTQVYHLNNLNLSSGIYLLKITGIDFSSVRKIVVE